MARKKKKKNKKRRGVKLSYHSRDFKGRGTFRSLPGGYFAYEGYIYYVKDFPAHEIIDMDDVDEGLIIDKYTDFQQASKAEIRGKKKKKKTKRSEVAWFYSNVKDCPDAIEIFERLRSRLRPHE